MSDGIVIFTSPSDGRLFNTRRQVPQQRQEAEHYAALLSDLQRLVQTEGSLISPLITHTARPSSDAEAAPPCDASSLSVGTTFFSLRSDADGVDTTIKAHQPAAPPPPALSLFVDFSQVYTDKNTANGNADDVVADEKESTENNNNNENNTIISQALHKYRALSSRLQKPPNGGEAQSAGEAIVVVVVVLCEEDFIAASPGGRLVSNCPLLVLPKLLIATTVVHDDQGLIPFTTTTVAGFPANFSSIVDAGCEFPHWMVSPRSMLMEVREAEDAGCDSTLPLADVHVVRSSFMLHSLFFRQWCRLEDFYWGGPIALAASGALSGALGEALLLSDDDEEEDETGNIAKALLNATQRVVHNSAVDVDTESNMCPNVKRARVEVAAAAADGNTIHTDKEDVADDVFTDPAPAAAADIAAVADVVKQICRQGWREYALHKWHIGGQGAITEDHHEGAAALVLKETRRALDMQYIASKYQKSNNNNMRSAVSVYQSLQLSTTLASELCSSSAPHAAAEKRSTEAALQAAYPSSAAFRLCRDLAATPAAANSIGFSLAQLHLVLKTPVLPITHLSSSNDNAGGDGSVAVCNEDNVETVELADYTQIVLALTTPTTTTTEIYKKKPESAALPSSTAVPAPFTLTPSSIGLLDSATGSAIADAVTRYLNVAPIFINSKNARRHAEKESSEQSDDDEDDDDVSASQDTASDAETSEGVLVVLAVQSHAADVNNLLHLVSRLSLKKDGDSGEQKNEAQPIMGVMPVTDPNAATSPVVLDALFQFWDMIAHEVNSAHRFQKRTEEEENACDITAMRALMLYMAQCKATTAPTDGTRGAAAHLGNEEEPQQDVSHQYWIEHALFLLCCGGGGDYMDYVSPQLARRMSVPHHRSSAEQNLNARGGGDDDKKKKSSQPALAISVSHDDDALLPKAETRLETALAKVYAIHEACKAYDLQLSEVLVLAYTIYVERWMEVIKMHSDPSQPTTSSCT